MPGGVGGLSFPLLAQARVKGKTWGCGHLGRKEGEEGEGDAGEGRFQGCCVISDVDGMWMLDGFSSGGEQEEKQTTTETVSVER